MTSTLLTEELQSSLLLQVEKPGRYAGNELNVIRKDHARATATMALVFPDLYDVGMSYYGFQILYHLINREPDLIAERAYAPHPDFARLLQARRQTLTSLETRRPLRDFTVLGFTLPYELTYTNILSILDLAGVTLLATERDESQPLVMGGGSGAFNPEPLAPFFDLFVVGDAEETIVPLVRFIGQKRARYSRSELLQAIVENFEGVYAPHFYLPDDSGCPRPTHSSAPSRIKALKVHRLKPEYYPLKPLMPQIAIAQDRLVVELMRGCTEGCRFCQAGMLYRPVRERPLNEILHQVKTGIAATGYDEVGLLSLSTSDYSAIVPLLSRLHDDLAAQGVALSYPSLRLDSCSEHLLAAGKTTRRSGLTFAPEAGSERLRRVINKQISDEDLIQATELARRYGWQVLKLYFMLGLPTETDEDLTAISDLCRRVIQAGQGRINLNITLATFIPKPFTPFQWEAMVEPDEIQRRLDWLKPLLRRLKGVKVMGRDPHSSIVEALLARGDRRLGRVILTAWQRGAQFEAWKEHFQPTIWREALAANNLTYEEFLASKSVEQALPWSHIDCGVTTDYLRTERERAFQAVTTPDCRQGCQGCGVCYINGPQMLYAAADEQLPAASPAETIPVPKPTRYLLHYRKFDRAIYLAHLDVMRLFQQSIRRAGLRPVMTQGFNPHTKMSAGQPLPLGYASEDELLEIVLTQPCEDLRERLNCVLPAGFEVVRVEPLASHTPAIFSRITALDYRVEFEQPLPSAVDQAIEHFLEASQVLVERVTPKKSASVDIRPLVTAIVRQGDRLLIQTRVEAGRTVKIAEILSELGLAGVNYRVVRLRSGVSPQ